MAIIERSQDITELLAKVGSKMDQSINSTSTPSSSEVCSWLNDAALLLSRLLPPHRLGGLRIAPITENDVGELLDLSDSGIIRTVGIKKYGTECTPIDQRSMDMVATRAPLLHTVRNPAVCVSGGSGDVYLQFWPTSPGPVTIKGIRRPTKYHDEGGWVPDEFSLPAELELGAVDYAVIQGKVQDEEPQQVQILYQMWTQQVGIETKSEGLGVD